MELFRHPFYAFIHDPQRKIITFRWTTETGGSPPSEGEPPEREPRSASRL
jgi:hypothetical protein